MSTITLHALRKRFAGSATDALAALDLSLASGERFVLLGPSGSGKSTLLRLIAGLETPSSGTIRIDSHEMAGVPPHRRGVGLLPQRPALYPHLTVRRQLAQTPAELLALLNVNMLLERLPHQLSGGEKQRVALARLVGQNRPIWLLDEPLSPLDPVFRAEFRHDLHLLLTHFPATMLLVTHDPSDAWALGRRIGVFGDGGLQQVGPADELANHPANRFVASTLGRFSLIDGIVTPGKSADSSPATFATEDGLTLTPLPAACVARADLAANPAIHRPGAGRLWPWNRVATAGC
jgi:ABC-type sugar transport system ATPase subunit